MEARQKLFNFFSKAHGLTLLESEQDDIIKQVFSLFSLCHGCGDIIHQGGQIQCAACEKETERRLAELIK